MSRVTLGEELDESCSFAEKAMWHARLVTQTYLNVTLDDAAKGMLQQWATHNSIGKFYQEFFRRYGVVFARGAAGYMEWSCRNCPLYTSDAADE